MSVREKLNQSTPMSLAVFGVAVAAAVAIFVWANADWFQGPITKAHFSSDDGKTYFVDSVSKIPPFDHDGKEAVQAFVYRAGSNPPFVGYLLTYPPEAARKLRALVTAPQTADSAAEVMNTRSNALVKRPGEAKWSSITSGRGNEIVTIQAPAGQTGELQSVEP